LQQPDNSYYEKLGGILSLNRSETPGHYNDKGFIVRRSRLLLV